MGRFFDGWSYYKGSHNEGRILLVWKSNILLVDIIQESDQYVHTLIKESQSKREYCVTFVYGRNTVLERVQLWQDLSCLKFPVAPWLMAGNFNSIFKYDDRCGGRPVATTELIDAQRWKAYGLADELRSIGSHFTWTNNQSDGARIYSKLDRVFKNEEWIDLFQASVAVKQWDIFSDHCYCLIKVIQEVNFGFKPFRFYNMWMEHERFKVTVMQSWTRPVAVRGFDGILVKLKRLSHVLRQFNKYKIGDVERNFQMANDNYNQAQVQLQQNPHSSEFQAEEKQALDNLVQNSRLYDSFLRKKSKVNWLKFGDDNTTFFHACLKQRKEVNRIASFVSDNGQLVENYEEVVAHFLFHFRSVLGSQSKASGSIHKDCFVHGNILSLEHQLALIKPFTKKDVKNAMFSIGSIKSLGPDGYGSGFFKSMWNEIGDDISAAVLGFFQQGILPKGLNNALLSLIPKVANPTKDAIHATQSKDFKFHPRCKNLNLVSLCFADDMVIFCKGNNTSIQIIQQCFQAFSVVSGLTANLEKSRVYFGGLTETKTKDILKDLHFVEGEFPLKYLGVPLRPTKWRGGDCANIIQKIKLKLHHWANRHLSFAGKAQLIHSVLLGIRAFWMSIFLLPKSVIAEIDHLCRRFLWETSREGAKWNMVLLAKYIWAVSTKQDILWVKWIDVVYLKGQSIWEYNLQTNVSWYWRKLIKLKSVINGEMLDKAMVNNKLKTSKLYLQLVNKERVPFAHVVWCNLTLPKHRFVLWQASLRHLLTRDNLLRCHLQLASILCPICELQQECHEHLFFQCQFSQQVRNRVAGWLGRDVWPMHYHGWVEWIVGKPKGIQQKVLAAGLATSVYLVWWNRNQCLFNYFSVSVNKAVTQVQNCLKARVSNVSKAKLKSKNLVFLENLNLL
ncbi:uncharacterized protein LOC133806292 [Humulus lupulus]|uniref:uncharacterized protein LOC133806292 n=1 Tax=Humulus lupulus TaxID=3486 RepID=UPI002B41812C|nr:uncharacterized protein LOC133806292 [Humulus lupulus]